MNLTEAIRATDPKVTWINELAKGWASPLYALKRKFANGLRRDREGCENRISKRELARVFEERDILKGRAMCTIFPTTMAARISPGMQSEIRVWRADITYLPMRRGLLYSAAIVDLSARKVLSLRTKVRGSRLSPGMIG